MGSKGLKNCRNPAFSFAKIISSWPWSTAGIAYALWSLKRPISIGLTTKSRPLLRRSTLPSTIESRPIVWLSECRRRIQLENSVKLKICEQPKIYTFLMRERAQVYIVNSIKSWSFLRWWHSKNITEYLHYTAENLVVWTTLNTLIFESHC